MKETGTHLTCITVTHTGSWS